MATLTIEYNPRSSVVMSAINLLKQLSGVKVVESPYDPAAVKRIKKSAAGPAHRVDIEKLWE